MSFIGRICTRRAHYIQISRAIFAGILPAILLAAPANLTGDGDGRGFNFWGSGGHVSADGEHDGVDYDGDTSAFTLGIDTNWRDGLIGWSLGAWRPFMSFALRHDSGNGNTGGTADIGGGIEYRTPTVTASTPPAC